MLLPEPLLPDTARGPVLMQTLWFPYGSVWEAEKEIRSPKTTERKIRKTRQIKSNCDML